MDVLRVFYAQRDPTAPWQPWHIHHESSGEILKVKAFVVQGEIRSEENGPIQGIPRYVLICRGTVTLDESGLAVIVAGRIEAKKE